MDQATIDPTEYTLTTDAAAQVLGYSPKVTERMARAGRIPAIRRKRRWWFRKVDLDTFLARSVEPNWKPAPKE